MFTVITELKGASSLSLQPDFLCDQRRHHLQAWQLNNYRFETHTQCFNFSDQKVMWGVWQTYLCCHLVDRGSPSFDRCCSELPDWLQHHQQTHWRTPPNERRVNKLITSTKHTDMEKLPSQVFLLLFFFFLSEELQYVMLAGRRPYTC